MARTFEYVITFCKVRQGDTVTLTQLILTHLTLVTVSPNQIIIIIIIIRQNHKKMQLRLYPYLSPKTGVRRYYHRIKIFEFCIAKAVGERRHIFGERKQTSPSILFLPLPQTGYYLLIFFSEFCLAVGEFEYIF